MRLVVEKQISDLRAHFAIILNNTYFAIRDEIEHEMIARILADLIGAANEASRAHIV